MKKVFISYVRENIEIVKRLYQELKSHGIQVWLDRNDIDPGSYWEQAIRRAIQQGAFFIACFSEEYHNRGQTYMNQELTFAIDELHQRSPDQIWFIPVKLNECEIPDRDIGGGKTLQALQYVNLYENWDDSIQRILKVIQPGLSEPVISANAVEQSETQVQPQDANAYFDQGNVYQSKGDYDRAIEAFNTAIELKPDFAEAYTNRGVTYTDKGDFAPAISDYTKAIELKPDFALAYNHRGIAYTDKGDFDRAIVDFNTAIELKPDYANYYNRGKAYDINGYVDCAIEDCTKAIDLKPDLAEAYYIRGRGYREKGDFDRAIADYTQAIEHKPDFAEAYNNRGEAWLHLGEWENARSNLTVAVAMGVNIIQGFRNEYGSVPDFEDRNGVKLPADLAAMLTPQQ